MSSQVEKKIVPREIVISFTDGKLSATHIQKEILFIEDGEVIGSRPLPSEPVSNGGATVKKILGEALVKAEERYQSLKAERDTLKTQIEESR